MRRLLTSAALVIALTAAPAMAKNKSEKNKSSSENGDIMKQAGQNREPGPDGTFQGKPVVQGPADWSKGNSANAGSGSDSSSGSSSGESGSDR